MDFPLNSISVNEKGDKALHLLDKQKTFIVPLHKIHFAKDSF